jgi:hypothetical protein
LIISVTRASTSGVIRFFAAEAGRDTAKAAALTQVKNEDLPRISLTSLLVL